MARNYKNVVGVRTVEFSGKNISLFDACSFNAYYAMVKDGVFIEMDDETGVVVHSREESDEYDDEEKCVKTYFARKTATGKGVIVGFVDLHITAELEVMYDDGYDTGVGYRPERHYVERRPKDIVRCAVVYYANNSKHYVPLDAITEVFNAAELQHKVR